MIFTILYNIVQICWLYRHDADVFGKITFLVNDMRRHVLGCIAFFLKNSNPGDVLSMIRCNTIIDPYLWPIFFQTTSVPGFKIDQQLLDSLACLWISTGDDEHKTCEYLSVVADFQQPPLVYLSTAVTSDRMTVVHWLWNRGQLLGHICPHVLQKNKSA